MLLLDRPPILTGLVWPTVATQDSSTITLAFSNSVVARSYEYAVSSTSAQTGFGAWTALASNKIITGLSSSTAYWIKVRTVHGINKGPQSRIVTATTDAGGGSLTRTLEDTETDATSSGSPPSGTSTAFTPANSSLLVVVGSIQGVNATPGTMSISDSLGTLTWTARVGPTTPTASGDYYGRIACWTAPVTTGASMTVTVASSETTSGDDAHTNIVVLCYEGYNTGSPVGGIISDNTTDDDARTITLSAAPATGDETVAFRMRGGGLAAGGATPGSGWTEVADLNSAGAGYNDLQVMVRTGSTSDQVTWDDLNTGGGTSIFTHCGALVIKVA